MEIKAYIRILATWWWIVLPTFLTVFSACLLLTFSQTPVYQSVATYVVKIRFASADDRLSVSALDTLSRNHVTLTLAEIANSRLIRSRAASELGLSGAESQDISVSARPVAGTSVISIVVEGSDRALIRDFAASVGAQTAAHARGLYPAFELELLDQPTLPSAPARPNIALNLVSGALAGLALGAGLAFLAHYLKSPLGGDMPDRDLAVTRLMDESAEELPGRHDLLDGSPDELESAQVAAYLRRHLRTGPRDRE